MTYPINLAFGWIWVTAGIVWGFTLGLSFHDDHWLGGYTSIKRRLYRLAHISFFGLAILNLLFYFAAAGLDSPGRLLDVASWGFVIGGVAMPVACFTMAHRPQWRAVFVVPVVALAAASVLTCWEVIGP